MFKYVGGHINICDFLHAWRKKIRMLAMTANTATMAYTAATYIAGTHSIASFFILHTALLIMNGHRLRRLRRCATHSSALSPVQEDKNTKRPDLSRNVPSSPSGINMYQWNNNGTPR